MTVRRRALAEHRKVAGYSQEKLAELLRVEPSTVGRWERGETTPQPWVRPNMAKALQLSPEQLDDILSEPDKRAALQLDTVRAGEVPCVGPIDGSRPGPYPDYVELAAGTAGRPDLIEIEDMKRRELLRLFSMTGTLLAMPSMEIALGSDRIVSAADRSSRLDTAKLDEYAQLNRHLWRVFTLAPAKREVLPLVRNQLDVLSDGLRQSHEHAVHQRLCMLATDLFQLAGEIFFDGNRYTDAAHCYTLAATAGNEARAFDMWACALTRHAFIAVYESRFSKAAPMLELAAALAHRGNHALSTRQWVAVVQAETFAGLGDLESCQRALDTAEHVRELPAPVHNGGWLRFDGSRLAEERGTCYLTLGRLDLAETALNEALSNNLTARRRASVLTDLAVSGAQRRDPERVVAYADLALEAAHRTGSGVISRKLRGLQPHLAPLRSDKQVRRLDTEISALPRQPITR